LDPDAGAGAGADVGAGSGADVGAGSGMGAGAGAALVGGGPAISVAPEGTISGSFGCCASCKRSGSGAGLETASPDCTVVSSCIERLVRGR
jgi:hypothetical protein